MATRKDVKSFTGMVPVELHEEFVGLFPWIGTNSMLINLFLEELIKQVKQQPQFTELITVAVRNSLQRILNGDIGNSAATEATATDHQSAA